jgi:hypothetical protein
MKNFFCTHGAIVVRLEKRVFYNDVALKCILYVGWDTSDEWGNHQWEKIAKIRGIIFICELHLNNMS